MAYVPVPKDLTKVKTKVMFNLTKRQLICFTGGALIGVPLFFLLRKPTGNSVAAMCMMLVMLPFFMLAMYEKHGQPLEKIVGNILKVAVIRPKQRPYQTNNFYAVLKRQEMLDKEMSVQSMIGILSPFDAIYDRMNAAERRDLVKYLISEVELFPREEQKTQKRFVKAIAYKFPIEQKVLTQFDECGASVETVCLLVK